MRLLIASWLVLLIGGMFAPLLGGRRAATLAGCGSAAAGCALGLTAALQVLVGGQTLSQSWATTLPGLTLAVHLDALAAFFLLPLFLLGLAAAVYGGEYMRHDQAQLPGLHWLYVNLLLLSMAMVIAAANALFFFFAWEIMSLSSFLLVIGQHRDQNTFRAGLIYLVATHLGAALLLGAFLLLGAQAGSLDFPAFAVLGPLPTATATLLFSLLLAGFGSKAGLFPLHVWLPEAHPAAPSHVSALMSGVMVKTAIYGFLRCITFLPAPPPWWGGVLMALGMSGALAGISLAAFQNDIKRSLAYSTVENVGLIFLSLGFWLFCRAQGHDGAAALALVGALLHLWNHALFKGLLFLGAGALLHGAGSRNMNRLGGLLRRMPLTGGCLAVGALAVAALPPANGLVGEWFIYRALLEAGTHQEGLAAFFPLVLVGLLALVGGMVMIVFSRLIGLALGGEPRHAQAAQAHECGPLMVVPMLVLAALCLLGGLLPGWLISPALRVAEQLDPTAPGLLLSLGLLPDWLGGMAAMVLAALLLAWGLGRWRQGARKVRTESTWGCGYAFPSSRMSYSAEGFSELAATSFFNDQLRPRAEGGQSMQLFPETGRFRQQAPDLVLDAGFLPLFAWLAGHCNRLRRLQAGLVHVYVFYILSVIVALLTWVAIR